MGGTAAKSNKFSSCSSEKSLDACNSEETNSRLDRTIAVHNK
jgi:hypothetical protein